MLERHGVVEQTEVKSKKGLKRLKGISDILMKNKAMNLQRANVAAFQMIYADFTGSCLKAGSNTYT